MKGKYIAFLFTCWAACSNSYAQNSSKLNFGAALALNDPSAQEKNITLLVKGVVSHIQRTVEQLGGTFRYSAGDIASVTIKAKQIELLAREPFVNCIEADSPFSKMQVMSDTMLVHNRVLPVHAGMAPLNQAYKGDGVVVGIIDTGIDYKHPDFQDSTGKTRIKFLWDQVLPDSVPPLPYNYGQEWTAADIDNGKATKHILTAESNYGHGTHVSSVATGNGLAINKYEGVAPNADIIFVAADLNCANCIVDAAKYIYAKAAILGKPCVINMSLGDYYGSHDGLDLRSQTVKNLIMAQPGRSFVAAAGNAGDLPIHLGYSVTNDTSFTWFSGSAYIAMYADTANFKNVNFAIGADKVTPSYSFRGNIPFSTISSHVGVLKNDTIYNGGNRICTILSYGYLSGGVYSMEYVITPDSSAYFWRLMTTGSGKFDTWSFDVETANLADIAVYPALQKYKQPDLISNMVSDYQCLDEVITVGNYTNRNQYTDYDTILQIDTTRIPGNLFPSSSHGPTRDGRIKPDITSPGDWTIGALVTSQVASLIAVGNSDMMAPGGYHILDGGTSNASPSVAGIAALYLQMAPGASWQQIKNSIINCARLDSHTGLNLPDNNWGYGKADAYVAMTGCVTSNNNIENIDNEYFTIYPNPAGKIFTVSGIQPGAKQISIYNVIGSRIYNKAVTGRKETIELDAPAGIYFCTLHDGEKVIGTRKLILTK